MKKNKIVALIVLGIILLQIVIPSLADIDWNVVFAEEINTWDISQNGDESVMATLSDDGTLTISGNGKMKDWRNSSDVAWYGNWKIKNVIINNGVTSIGNYAFYMCPSLNITIPNSVTSIGKSAFSYCSDLISITIPNSVTSIGNYAFEYCSNLTSITIPNNVTSIGNRAFGSCRSLTTINVDFNNEKYMSDNGVLFTKDKKTLIQYPSKKEGTEYLISQGVESIENYAFWGCGNLTNIIIPDSVTDIGISAFEDCTSLTSITIPSRVTGIGIEVFNGCISLTSINVDSNNEEYMSDNGVLYTKDKKTLIQYPSKKEGMEYLILQGVENIESHAFYKCTSLTRIIIPDSVTIIGTGAFSNCKNLTSITIPDSVISIVNYVFYDCTNLINITIPNSVTSIGECAFFSCTSLTNITIPSSVTSIGNYAFSDCTSLTNITIPSSVTSIEYGAFHWCTSLTNITIPNGVTSIGGYAFEGCSSLTSITISNSVTSIGEEVFKYCTNLASINVDSNNEKYMSDNGVLYTKDKKTLIQYPSKKEGTEYIILQGVESIESYAFYKCTSLTRIIIPNSVTNIGKYAINECNNLNAVYFEIEANTTIAQLKEKIKTNGTIKVLKDNNEITDTNTLVGTGMQMQIETQIETEKYIAIVKADLNGDGKIGLSDLSNIKFSLIGKKQLSIEAQIAGDINGDGKVSLSDMAKLKMYLVGKANI